MKRFLAILLLFCLTLYFMTAANAITLDTQAVYGTVFAGVETETTKAGVNYYHYETLVLNQNGEFELHITNTSNGMMAYSYAKGKYTISKDKITFKYSEGYQMLGFTSGGYSTVTDWKPKNSTGKIMDDDTIVIAFMGYSGGEFTR